MRSSGSAGLQCSSLERVHGQAARISPPARRPLRHFDDVFLHRTQHGKEFVLFPGWHVERIQCLDEVFNQGIEGSRRDFHAGMRCFHVFPLIGAGAAAGLADLVDQLFLQVRQIGVGKPPVDALVLRPRC